MKIEGNANFVELMEKLREAYVKNRDVQTYKQINCGKLNRGRSHSISSISEDYLACFMLELLNDKDVVIFTDQAITRKNGNERAKTYYPDILVCKKINNNDDVNKSAETYRCFYACDVKTDIGWIRNSLSEICKNHSEQIARFCCKRLRSKDGKTKKEFLIKFDKNVKYDLVIISSGNGLLGTESLDNGKKVNLKYRKENSVACCLLLSEGGHLNNYGDDENITIRSTNDYEKWIERIKDSIK